MDAMRLVCIASILLTASLIICEAAKGSNVTEELLHAHNKERTLVGVPPLVWNAKIAAFASLYARAQRNQNHCELVYSGTKRYGENLFWVKGMPITPALAVQAWIDEKKFYSYKNNSCQSGQPCGVYTQVVWKETTQLGCAWVTCDKGDVTLIVCNYFPPGNVVGERPFELP
eukprot:Gb_07639 [translate_table: standard]